MATTITILPLLYKHLQGTLTDEEAAQLQTWILASPHHRQLLDQVTNDDILMEDLLLHAPASQELLKERMYARIRDGIAPAPVVRLKRYWWAAASALLLLAAGGYYWLAQPKNNKQAPPVAAAADMAPASKGAVLTLGDGRQIVLDSLQNGVVANEAGVPIQLQEHQLKYDRRDVTTVTYNTLTTPRGRLFQVVLPDGTKAWLNAASSLRYPIAFSQNERKVEVSGEVYFEVAKEAAKTFIVQINGSARVEVLGTHFNVNAYPNDEQINTTLLEGKVKVVAATRPIILTPGKQAQVQQGNIRVVSVNLDKVMAWKNGWFDFEGVPLPAIMRQLERWYDIEVVYPKGVPNLSLTGEMTRDVTLQGLLHGLQQLGLHYELKERKLIILP